MKARTLKRMFGIALAFVLGVGTAVAPIAAEAAPRQDADEEQAQAADLGDATQGELRANRRDGTALGACPLEHTDVKAEISGFLARVTVTQNFVNPFAEKIEAVYVFPLSQRAAVDRMTMRVGTKTIEGEIKRRDEAHKIYEEARDRGYVASLLDQERPNIFTQSVANIMPGERVDVTISYLDVLSYKDGSYQFVFPMVVAPRYIPGAPLPAAATGPPSTGVAADTDKVPDASRITPVVAPPGTRAGHDISLEVALDAGVPVLDVRSTLHEVDVQRTSDHSARVRLADDDVIPNRDFILTYDVAGGRIEDAVLAHRDERGGFFTLILQPPDRVATEDVTPKELVFVLDTSGSMDGFPIEKAKECIGLALDGLYPSDTFNLITFAGDTYVLFPEPVPATAENLAKAHEFLESRSGGGGTEMMTAIRTALEPSDKQDHVRIVCFMTDGEVGNDMEILGEIQKHPNARVFSFGIGDSVNRFLLDKMAEEGRGEAEYVTLKDDGSAAARRFHERVRSPLLTDVTVDWGGLEVADVYPSRIPDLFSATPVILCGRFERAQSGEIRVRGRAGGRDVVRTLQFRLPKFEAANDSLASLWARMRIDDLMRKDFEGIQLGKPRQDLFEKITDLGLRFNLVTQYTSFVAVDNTVSTGTEKPRLVPVPVELPEGIAAEPQWSAPAGATVTAGPAPELPAPPPPKAPKSPSVATARGSIVGTVTDPSGAFVTGATVTLTADRDATTRTATVGSDGRYTFGKLPAGSYRIAIDAPGFKKTIVGAVVGAGRVVADITLSVGGVSESVEILAGEQGVQVNTANQTLSTAVTEHQVKELPLISRNPYALAQLSPGTARGASGGTAASRYVWHEDGDLALKLDQSLAGVADGEVTVQLWLVSRSPEALAKLRALGFVLERDVKGRNRVVGRVPAKNLSALAALAAVRYVARA